MVALDEPSLDDIVKRFREVLDGGTCGDLVRTQAEYCYATAHLGERMVRGEITLHVAEQYAFVPKVSQWLKYRLDVWFLIAKMSVDELQYVADELPGLLLRYGLPETTVGLEMVRLWLRFPCGGTSDAPPL